MFRDGADPFAAHHFRIVAAHVAANRGDLRSARSLARARRDLPAFHPVDECEDRLLEARLRVLEGDPPPVEAITGPLDRLAALAHPARAVVLRDLIAGELIASGRPAEAAALDPPAASYSGRGATVTGCRP